MKAKPWWMEKTPSSPKDENSAGTSPGAQAVKNLYFVKNAFLSLPLEGKVAEQSEAG